MVIMKKVVYWILGIAIVIQVIRPDFNNPIINQATTLNADPAVMSVLKNSCYDCHSSETKYPWYHNIAPMSWIMSDNISRGRQALDFSNWASIDSETKIKRLERAKQVVTNEMMPKREYLMMHKNAVLKDSDRETLKQFFDLQLKELGAPENTF